MLSHPFVRAAVSANNQHQVNYETGAFKRLFLCSVIIERQKETAAAPEGVIRSGDSFVWSVAAENARVVVAIETAT